AAGCLDIGWDGQRKLDELVVQVRHPCFERRAHSDLVDTHEQQLRQALPQLNPDHAVELTRPWYSTIDILIERRHRATARRVIDARKQLALVTIVKRNRATPE